jgi:enamine deaminase RidA (YjgF/YER057c/UK114 family)
VKLEIVNPEGLARPRGYSHGVQVSGSGSLLFVAGQIGWNHEGMIVDRSFAAQFEQALGNFLQVVAHAGGKPEHVTKMTLFVTDTTEYLASVKEVGDSYRRHMGRHYPAMTLVQVSGLLEEGAKVEIEGVACLPV